MELTIPERLMAQTVLPAKGNFVTLRVVMETQRALGFTSDEIAEFGLTSEVGPEGQLQTKWKPEHAETVRDIHISDAAMAILKEELDKLNGDAQLTANHLSLFEKVHATATE